MLEFRLKALEHYQADPCPPGAWISQALTWMIFIIMSNRPMTEGRSWDDVPDDDQKYL